MQQNILLLKNSNKMIVTIVFVIGLGLTFMGLLMR